MAARRRGGSGGFLSRAAWVFVGGSVGMALWQGAGHGDLKSVLDNLRDKNQRLEQRYNHESPKVVNEITKKAGTGTDPATKGSGASEPTSTSTTSSTTSNPGSAK